MSVLEETRIKLEELRNELIPKYKEKIEKDEGWKPVCICLYGDGATHFLYLEYDGSVERADVFEEMNDYLESSEAVGCVLVMETEYRAEDLNYPNDALYVSIRGTGVKEMTAFPFKRDTQSKVVWLEQVGPLKGFQDGFITAFATEFH